MYCFHRHSLRTLSIIAGIIFALVIAGCTLVESGDDSASPAPTPVEETDAQDVESTAADDTVAADHDDALEPEENDADTAAGDVSPIERAVEMVRPAVAFLAVEVERTGAFGIPEQQEGVGSGFIFDEEGFILTNNHVIDGATNIGVVLPDGRRFDGTVVGRSPDRDLAVIEIETDEELPVIPLGSGDELRVGQTVVAIGNALGLPGGPTVTTGVVSALGRTMQPGMGQPPMEDLVQTDAAINPGNSGGPLVNLDGEVIGINTARIQQAEGIGFAVSVDTASRFISQVVDREPQPFIGISGLDLSPAIAEQYQLPLDRGVVIVNISPGTPADDVGLQPGDILIGLNDATIDTMHDLQEVLEQYQPGDVVILRINRDGTEQEIELTLGESPIVE